MKNNKYITKQTKNVIINVYIYISYKEWYMFNLMNRNKVFSYEDNDVNINTF